MQAGPKSGKHRKSCSDFTFVFFTRAFPDKNVILRHILFFSTGVLISRRVYYFQPAFSQ